MTYLCDDCGASVDGLDLDPYQDWTGEKLGCCPYCGSVELIERNWWEHDRKAVDALLDKVDIWAK